MKRPDAPYGWVAQHKDKGPWHRVCAPVEFSHYAHVILVAWVIGSRCITTEWRYWRAPDDLPEGARLCKHCVPDQ